MTTATGRQLTISPSTINAAECPFYFRAYQDQKSLGITDHEGPETPLFFLVGRFAHRVVELYTKSLLRLKQHSDLKLFEDIFKAVWDINRYIPESMYDAIKDDILLPFIESYSVDPDITWGAEVDIALDWNLDRVEWDSPDAWLRCKLDRVDIYPDAALITDYKTSYHIPSDTELKASLQSQIYPFVLHKLNSYLPKYLIQYHYVRWNKKTTPIESTPAEFNRVEKRLRGFTERMTQKLEDARAEWPAIPCDLCRICSFECPLLTTTLRPLKTLTDAQEIGRAILRKKQEIDDLTETLKAFAKDTPIEIEAGIYGYHPTETYRGFRAEKLVEFAAQRSLDVSLLLKPDTDKIKKIDDAIRADVLAMAKVSIGTRFGFKERE